MDIILKAIFYFFVWFFAPAVLLGTLQFLGTVHRRAAFKSQKYATRAAFWAGFMLFVIVLIYQISIFMNSGFPNNDVFIGFNLPLSLASALVVFIIATPAVINTWLVLLLTFVNLFALFHYIFVRTYNDIILSVVTGMVLGFLTHIAASLSSVSEFLGKKESSHKN